VYITAMPPLRKDLQHHITQRRLPGSYTRPMQLRGRIGNTIPSPTRNYNYNYITAIHYCSHHHHFYPTMFLRRRSQGARRHSPNLIEFNRNSLFHSKRYSRYLFYAKTIPDWLQCNWSSSPKMIYIFPDFIVFYLALRSWRRGTIPPSAGCQ